MLHHIKAKGKIKKLQNDIAEITQTKDVIKEDKVSQTDKIWQLTDRVAELEEQLFWSVVI